jgi:hypothetical protein
MSLIDPDQSRPNHPRRLYILSLPPTGMVRQSRLGEEARGAEVDMWDEAEEGVVGVGEELLFLCRTAQRSRQLSTMKHIHQE